MAPVGSSSLYASVYQQEANAYSGRGSSVFSCQPALLSAYIPVPTSIFLCPADVPNKLTYQRSQFITSYMWNGAVEGYGNHKINNVPTPYKLSDFRRTDCILMWENDETLTDQWNDFSQFPRPEGVSQRHGKGGTVGFFDGSLRKDLISWTFTNRPSKFPPRHALWPRHRLDLPFRQFIAQSTFVTIQASQMAPTKFRKVRQEGGDALPFAFFAPAA